MAPGHSNVTVVMTTYAPESLRVRETYACRSWVGLAENLVAPFDLKLHTADDGSFDHAYLQNIRQSASKQWGRLSTASLVNRGGIGASLNAALKFVEDDLWMYTTDDWLLTRKLDLIKAIKLIDIGYDYVRLGPIHPHLACATQFNVDIGWWLQLHQKFGGFAFATRPFLATKRFYERVGPFKEQCDSYVCERDYADRVSEIDTLTLGAVNLEGPWQDLGQDDVSIGKVHDPAWPLAV